MTVRSARAALIACWMSFSLMLSSAEVPSSRIRIGGFLRKIRASAIRCLWPPERFWPALGDAGLVAAGHPHDLIMDAGQLGGPADLLWSGFAAAIGDVGGDRAREDERILADIADQPADGLAGDGLSRGTPPIEAVPAVGCTSRKQASAARWSCRNPNVPPRRWSRRGGSPSRHMSANGGVSWEPLG